MCSVVVRATLIERFETFGVLELTDRLQLGSQNYFAVCVGVHNKILPNNYELIAILSVLYIGIYMHALSYFAIGHT